MPITKINPKGECDGCPKTDVDLFPAPVGRGMMLCAGCLALEVETASKQSLVESMLDDSKDIDQRTQIKSDVFLAPTVPTIELRGLINADERIPASEKSYAFVKECDTRYQSIKAAIFAKREELASLEAEARVLQRNIQLEAGNLRVDLRKKYENFDIEYKPSKLVKPQVVKATKVKAKSFGKADLHHLKFVAAKYGVPVGTVQQIILKDNCTAEVAAKKFAELMGLPLPVEAEPV